MRETGPWEKDWIVNSSEEAMGKASLFTFSRALKTFTRYEVVTRFSLKTLGVRLKFQTIIGYL